MKSLNGSIPAELGTLFQLTHLDLSSIPLSWDAVANTSKYQSRPRAAPV